MFYSSNGSLNRNSDGDTLPDEVFIVSGYYTVFNIKGTLVVLPISSVKVKVVGCFNNVIGLQLSSFYGNGSWLLLKVYRAEWLYLAKNGNKTGEMDGDTFIAMLPDITVVGKMTE